MINDEGQEVVCNVLFTFDNADESRHYIVYTDNTQDQEGNVKVYASMYDPPQEDQMELLPIETPEEWAVIEDILTSIQEEIKNGEHVDSEDEDEDDDISVYHLRSCLSRWPCRLFALPCCFQCPLSWTGFISLSIIRGGCYMDCPFPGMVHISGVHPTGSILRSNRVKVHLRCIL